MEERIGNSKPIFARLPETLHRQAIDPQAPPLICDHTYPKGGAVVSYKANDRPLDLHLSAYRQSAYILVCRIEAIVNYHADEALA
jgi:hypothetical protein